MGALGLPNYRSFSLEEIEAATNNFDTSSLMGEDSYGQVCHILLIIFVYLEEIFPFDHKLSECVLALMDSIN